MEENHNDENSDTLKTLECIFCKARLYFSTKDVIPKKYQNHLQSQHEIIYQIELVVQSTFEQQYPELVKPKPKESCKGCENRKETKSKDQNHSEEHVEVLDEDYDSDLEILSDSETVFAKPQSDPVSVPAKKPGPKSKQRNRSPSSENGMLSSTNQNSDNMIEIKDKYGKSVFLKKFPNDRIEEKLQVHQPRIRSDSEASAEDSSSKLLSPVAIKQEYNTRSYESLEVQPDFEAPSSENENNETIEAPNDGPIVVNWHTGTLHGCKACTRQFIEAGEFRQHISSEHTETSLEQMTEENGGDLTVVKNFYECLVCGRGLQHCTNTIRQHLNKAHKMNMTAYYEQYKDEIDQDLPELPITDPHLLMQLGKRNERKERYALHEDLRNASVDSHWIDRCVYGCALCSTNVKFDSYDKARDHLKSEHNISVKEYTREHGSLTVQDVWHTCQLCWAVIKWSPNQINHHLSYTHHMTKTAYHAQYINTYTDTPDVVEYGYEPSQVQWMNRSVYSCEACVAESPVGSNMQHEFSTQNQLYEHITKHHKLEKADYFKKFSDPCIGAGVVLHDCQLCDKKVRWDQDSLIAHIMNLHKMEPMEYESEYMKHTKGGRSKAIKETSFDASERSVNVAGYWSNECIFECKICFQKFQNKKHVTAHYKINHDMTMAYHEEHMGTSLLEKRVLLCQLCEDNREIIWDSSYLVSHIASHKEIGLKDYKKSYVDAFEVTENEVICEELETNKWLYQCEFGCKICSKKFLNRRNFYLHLKQDHNLDIGGYKKRNGNPEFSKKIHVCQFPLCNKSVVWDGPSMINHFQTHNSNPESYYKRFMDHYNEREEDNLLAQMEKCTFVCKLCQVLFDSKQILITHVKDNHHIKNFVDEYQSVHGDSVAKLVLHTCMLCKENVLWDKAILEEHLKYQHGVLLINYIKENLREYKENEECAQQHKQKSEWMDGCAFECTACKATFTKKTSLGTHVFNIHRDIADKTTIQETTKSTTHMCQICATPMEWERRSIKYHLESKHNIQAEVYQAKYMGDYSNDEEVIKSRQSAQREERKKNRENLPNGEGNDGGDASHQFDEDEDDADEWRTEEVRTWAKGCLYYCELCPLDVAGLKDFTSHLANKHKTSFKQHAAKYQMKNVVLRRNFHFCKMCFKNINHDEDDLKKHFRKDHGISVSDYFDDFKAKLKNPKLQRPDGTALKDEEEKKSTTTPSFDMSKKRPVNLSSDVQSSTSTPLKLFLDARPTLSQESPVAKKKMKIDNTDSNQESMTSNETNTVSNKNPVGSRRKPLIKLEPGTFQKSANDNVNNGQLLHHTSSNAENSTINPDLNNNSKSKAMRFGDAVSKGKSNRGMKIKIEPGMKQL